MILSIFIITSCSVKKTSNNYKKCVYQRLRNVCINDKLKRKEVLEYCSWNSFSWQAHTLHLDGEEILGQFCVVRR